MLLIIKPLICSQVPWFWKVPLIKTLLFKHLLFLQSLLPSEVQAHAQTRSVLNPSSAQACADITLILTRTTALTCRQNPTTTRTAAPVASRLSIRSHARSCAITTSSSGRVCDFVQVWPRMTRYRRRRFCSSRSSLMRFAQCLCVCLTAVLTNPGLWDLPSCLFHLQPESKTRVLADQELLKATIRRSRGYDYGWS